MIKSCRSTIKSGADLGGIQGPPPPPPPPHGHKCMHTPIGTYSMQVSCYTNCYTDSPAECSVNLASLSVWVITSLQYCHTLQHSHCFGFWIFEPTKFQVYAWAVGWWSAIVSVLCFGAWLVATQMEGWLWIRFNTQYSSRPCRLWLLP